MLPPPSPRPARGMVGGQKRHFVTRGMQAHFPWDDSTAFISRMAIPGFTPYVSKCDSQSFITVWSARTLCSYIRTTAVDFLDRLKCLGRCAEAIGHRLRVYRGSWQLKSVQEELQHQKIQMRNNNLLPFKSCSYSPPPLSLRLSESAHGRFGCL